MEKTKKKKRKSPTSSLKLPNLDKKIVKRKPKSKAKQAPKKSQLVKAPQSKFEIFDKKDIEQIVSGDPLSNQPFYYVPVPDDDSESGQKMVFGISYEGTIRIASLQKNLIVSGFINQDTEDLYCSVVSVKCMKRNLQILAMGTQEKIHGDPYGKIISLSKAQRNGLRRLLLKKNVVSVFNRWYESVFNKAPDLNNTVFVDESGEKLTLSGDGK